MKVPKRQKPKWLDFDDDDWRRNGSISRASELLGTHTWNPPINASQRNKLQRIAAQLVRLLNSVRNSSGDERVLKLQWTADSTNRGNNPSNDEIFLNPDLVKDDEPSPLIIDGLGGKTLIAATLKRTVDPASFEAAALDRHRDNTNRRLIWEAAEMLEATTQLVGEWPGAMAYVRRHEAMATSSAEAILAEAIAEPKSLRAATTVTAWQLLHPGQSLTFPEGFEWYQQAVDEAVALVKDGPVTYNTGFAAVDFLRTKFPLEEHPIAPKKPTATDSTLFGRPDPSKINIRDLPEGISQNEDLAKFDIPALPSGAPECTSHDWYKPTKDPSKFKLKERSRPLVERILANLQFRRLHHTFPLYGLKSGDFDDGALYKVGVPLRLQDPHPTIFQRNRVAFMPDVAIGLLVDESGSMRFPTRLQGEDSNRIECAALVAYAIKSAMAKLQGVHLRVYGHSTTPRGAVAMYEYDNLEDFYGMSARNDNADGWALLFALRRLQNALPGVRQKFMIHLSDGIPSACFRGCAYSGVPAMNHVKSVSDWGKRKFGIMTYGIGVGGSPDQKIGELMYGKGNFVQIDDPVAAAPEIGRFIGKVSAKQ